jgi:hypothetical protein
LPGRLNVPKGYTSVEIGASVSLTLNVSPANVLDAGPKRGPSEQGGKLRQRLHTKNIRVIHHDGIVGIELIYEEHAPIINISHVDPICMVWCL